MAVDTDNDRFLAAIAKLIELTQKKSLRWKSASAFEAGLKEMNALGAEPECRKIFITNYSGRQLRIYERSMIIPKAVAGRTPLKGWRPTLELAEPNGQGWWSFPKSDSIGDLLRAVQYQISGVDDFVEHLLKS